MIRDSLMQSLLEDEMRGKSKNVDFAEPDVIPPIPAGLEPPTVIAEIVEQEEKAKERMEELPKGDPVVVQSVPSNETKKTEEAKPAAPKPQVALNQRGQASTFDLDSAYRLAAALFRGKAFPDWVKSAEQALAVSLFLRNLGLEVMTGIQHVCEVKGRLTLWGEGPLAAVRASGNLKSIKEYFIDADYKEICLKNKNLDTPLYAAICITVRKDTGEKKETWFTNQDEATATQGVAAIWKGYKRIMYKRKARAENLKDNFGDILEGAGISEYDYEQAPDMPTGPAPVSLANQMNQALEDKREQEIPTQ